VLGVFFDQSEDVLSRVDSVEVFSCVLAAFLGNVHVGLRVFLPDPFNLDETLLNLELVPCIVTEVIDKIDVVVELKVKNAFEAEVFALFVELFFNLKPEVVPVTRSDRFIS
jgi:hypothetical protein